MAKMKFRVLGGKHIDNGKVYRKGEIVTSDVDLAEKFANKFQRVDGHETSLSEDHDPEAFTNADVLDNPKKKIKELGKEAKATALTKSRDPGATESELGENVTEDFEAAEEAGLLVFKEGKSFHVCEPEDAEKALNKKPLKQSEVGDFISEYAGAEEEEDEQEDEEEVSAPAPKKKAAKKKKG